MIGRQQAVSIQEQEIGRLACLDSVVAATCELKSIVRMSDKLYLEVNCFGEFLDDLLGFVGGPIIGHDHFISPGYVLLTSD